MPPKGGASRKRAKIGGPEDESSAELDASLMAVDLIVDSIKEQLDNMVQQPLEEIKAVVNSYMMRLPGNIQNMRMKDFLRDGAGVVATMQEKQKKESRAARTLLKPMLSTGNSRIGILGTVLKPSLNAAKALLNPGTDGLGGAPSRGMGAGELTATSLTTPGGPGGNARSRIPAPLGGGAGAGAGAMPMRTPALAHMKSAIAVGAGGHLAAATPGHAPFSGYLPTTPAAAHGAGADAGKLPRARRRNEVVFHVPMSSNGSPLDGGAEASAAGAGAAAPIGASASAAGASVALPLGDAAALDALAAEDDVQAQAMLEHLAAVMEQARVAQERILATRAAAAAQRTAAAAATAGAAGASGPVS